MHSAFINYKKSQIHYSHSARRSKTLLCFHGYSETAESFYFLENFLEEYTMIAVDLPFHGKTRWNEGLDFSGEDLQNIIISIFDAIGLANQANRKTTILGYSLGGRVALSLFQQAPHRYEKIILLAPDGLKVNFWYWLSTQTFFGNRFFKFTMKHPGWFFLFLRMLNKTRVVNQSIFKFTNYYINDKTIRTQLYQRWTCMRKLKPDIKKIKKLIQKNKVPVRLLYGEYDRIILPERGEKFRKGIEPWCELQKLSAGHQVLHEKKAALIIQLIQS